MITFNFTELEGYDQSFEPLIVNKYTDKLMYHLLDYEYPSIAKKDHLKFFQFVEFTLVGYKYS